MSQFANEPKGLGDKETGGQVASLPVPLSTCVLMYLFHYPIGSLAH